MQLHSSGCSVRLGIKPGFYSISSFCYKAIFLHCKSHDPQAKVRFAHNIYEKELGNQINETRRCSEIPAQDHLSGTTRNQGTKRWERHSYWSREANFTIQDPAVMALISSCQTSPFLTSLLKQIHAPARFSLWAFPSPYGFKAVLQFSHIVFALELFGNFPTQWGNSTRWNPNLLKIQLWLSRSAPRHFRPLRKLSCTLPPFSLSSQAAWAQAWVQEDSAPSSGAERGLAFSAPMFSSKTGVWSYSHPGNFPLHFCSLSPPPLLSPSRRPHI